HPTRSALHGVEERLASVLHCALVACQQLEAEPALHGRCRFRGDELLLRLNDRLQAPNTVEVYDEVQQYLGPCLASLYTGCQVAVERVDTPAAPLTVHIKAAENPDVSTLLGRLARFAPPAQSIGTR